MEFSPPQSTHIEFNQTNATVSIVESELDQYVINNVTAVCTSGATFDDLKIDWSDNRWRYSSTFDYAIPRKISYYNINKQDDSKLEYGVSWSVATLVDYDVAYSVETFVETTDLVFTITGKERHGTRVGANEDGTGGTIEWGPWTDFTTTYTSIIEINDDKSIEIIHNVVANGALAKANAKR